jgi:hypothetical protein
MQALNAFAAAVELPPELLLVLGLLPHAAASEATATTAIVTENALRTGSPSVLRPVCHVAEPPRRRTRDSICPSQSVGKAARRPFTDS